MGSCGSIIKVDAGYRAVSELNTVAHINGCSDQTCAAIALTVGLQVVLDQGYPDTMHTHVYNLFIFALLN